LCDEGGKLRRFLNVYVNSEDIRFLDNQTTSLSDGDEVSIVPAVAGG
jgi:molybdopterin converting factor small subunit